MSDPRPLRLPVSDFARLPLRTRRVPASTWSNLRWARHANRDDLFYASRSGRLTPAGGAVPCLYLAPDEHTAFLEVYGDKLHGDRESGRTPRIEATDFVEQVFLEVQAPDLQLADILLGEGLQAIHLDLGTLYAADVDYPRRFAQAIADHPAAVDGILYESRHTKALCAVVWPMHRALLRGTPFADRGLLASRAALSGSIATVFGHAVEVVS